MKKPRPRLDPDTLRWLADNCDSVFAYIVVKRRSRNVSHKGKFKAWITRLIREDKS